MITRQPYPGLPAPKTSSTTAASPRAFTLIEIVIVLTIIAILAGAAVPTASKFFNSRARTATREELDEIAGAVEEYFRDTFALPGSVDHLIANPGVSGWAGPYVTVSNTEPWSGQTDVQVDAWARAYQLEAQGASVVELRSAGEDGSFGDAKDIVFTVDVTPVRREKTLKQLQTVNQAITQYNSQYLPDSPLSTAYGALLDRLVSTGFLPDGAPFAADGWGSAFVPDPAGKSPVVAVTSSSLGGTSDGGSSSKGGKGKDKGKSSDKGKSDAKGSSSAKGKG